MKAWLYTNDKQTRMTAVLLSDDARTVYKIHSNVIVDTDFQLGDFIRQTLAGLPDVPPVKDYYESKGGGLISAIGKCWEIDHDMNRIAIIFLRGENDC